MQSSEAPRTLRLPAGRRDLWRLSGCPRARPTITLAWLLLAGCVEQTTPPPQAQQPPPSVESKVPVQIQMQFRFKPTRSFEDIDPSRIEPRIRVLPFIERYKLYDDRLSDADFVTLVVVLRDPTHAQLAALRDALNTLPDVQAFAVDRSGTTHPLSAVPPERLPEVAATDALGRK